MGEFGVFNADMKAVQTAIEAAYDRERERDPLICGRCMRLGFLVGHIALLRAFIEREPDVEHRGHLARDLNGLLWLYENFERHTPPLPS